PEGRRDEHCQCVAGANAAPSANPGPGPLDDPPQTIIEPPVQTAVGSRRPLSGACGSADQRFVFGSYASPWGGSTSAPARPVPAPQRTSSLRVQTAADPARPDSIGGRLLQRLVAGL